MVTRVNRAIQARNAVPCRTGADQNLVRPDNDDGPERRVKSSGMRPRRLLIPPTDALTAMRLEDQERTGGDVEERPDLFEVPPQLRPLAEDRFVIPRSIGARRNRNAQNDLRANNAFINPRMNPVTNPRIAGSSRWRCRRDRSVPRNVNPRRGLRTWTRSSVGWRTTREDGRRDKSSIVTVSRGPSTYRTTWGTCSPRCDVGVGRTLPTRCARCSPRRSPSSSTVDRTPGGPRPGRTTVRGFRCGCTPDLDLESLPCAGDPVVVAARPPTPQDQSVALARCPVGADR
jgi:hypothetical protein